VEEKEEKKTKNEQTSDFTCGILTIFHIMSANNGIFYDNGLISSLAVTVCLRH
jgi:hypothetical protein